MKIPERTLRISAATLLALLMVSGAYLLSGPSFLSERFANAGSTDELLKAYAVKDSDGDGLPDWQEALYGTDPNKAISNPFGIPDGEAAREGKLTPQTSASQLPSDLSATTSVADILSQIPGVDPAPGSVTEQFSHQFLQEYMSASGGQSLSQNDQQALVQKLSIEFGAKAAQQIASPITFVAVHANKSVSLSSYANAVEQIILAHDVSDSGSEPLTLMDQLINKNDESARPKLKTLQAAYAAIASDLSKVSVPLQLTNEHLLLMQSFDSLARATNVVVSYEKDPLGVMGALSLYQPASENILKAFNVLASTLVASGEPQPGDPGSLIVQIARSSQVPTQ